MFSLKPNNKAQAFIVILIGLYLGYIGIEMLTKGVPADAAPIWPVLNVVFAVVFIAVALFTVIVSIRTFSDMVKEDRQAAEETAAEEERLRLEQRAQESDNAAGEAPEEGEDDWDEADVAELDREEAQARHGQSAGEETAPGPDEIERQEGEERHD